MNKRDLRYGDAPLNTSLNWKNKIVREGKTVAWLSSSLFLLTNRNLGKRIIDEACGVDTGGGNCCQLNFGPTAILVQILVSHDNEECSEGTPKVFNFLFTSINKTRTNTNLIKSIIRQQPLKKYPWVYTYTLYNLTRVVLRLACTVDHMTAGADQRSLVAIALCMQVWLVAIASSHCSLRAGMASSDR